MTQPDPELALLEQEILNELSAAGVAPHLVVAFSGGLDSKVLLHALVRLRSLGYISQLSAIHVNHKLQKAADEWQAQCESDCRHYQVQLQIAQLPQRQENASNLEAIARDGRYRAFETLLGEQHCLLMAHHQDDQVETLLFRLLRGCGISGAAAMPVSRPLGRGFLLRPMLNLSRAQLEEYARNNQLSWIEDPTNLQHHYSRNYIRHRLIPVIADKWPSYATNLTRFTRLAREQSQLLAELAEDDLRQVGLPSGNLDIAGLLQLSPARQKNLLHCWASGEKQLPPSSNEINQVLSQSQAAANGAAINIDLGDRLVRSYAGQLMLLTKQQPDDVFEDLPWLDLSQPLQLSNGVVLNFQETSADDSQIGLRLPNVTEQVWVRQRQGGEMALPDYRGRTTSLKKIYQELAVPPWQRSWLPLIYYGEQLVAVPGVFIAKAFLSEPGQASLQLSLQQPATLPPTAN